MNVDSRGPMVFLSKVSLVYQKAANLVTFTVCVFTFLCIKIFPTFTGFVLCETWVSAIILWPVKQKLGKINDNNIRNTTCQMPHSQTSQYNA